MTAKDTDIAVIGGGSTGLALAYHCISGGESPAITIVEARSSYRHDRIWCFWDFNELLPELEALVRHRWSCWRFSTEGDEVIHKNSGHPYCAINSGDYYQAVTERISGSKSVELITDCKLIKSKAIKDGFQLETTRGDLRCKRVIDTRPPYPDYLLGASGEIPEILPEGFAGTPIFQVFFGIEITAEMQLFDPATACLMTDMSSSDDGLEFLYMLPFSKTSALIEVTRFSRRFMMPEQLRDCGNRLLSSICGQTSYSVEHKEGAVLPMGLPLVQDIQPNWVQAGICGGALRPSTGYGFIRTHRWAASCATALRAGKPILRMGKPSSFQSFLDHLFLDVLSSEPQMSATIFLGMGKKLPPDCFARFMMEKSSVLDYWRMITAMPTMLFLQRFAAKVTGGQDGR